MMTNISPETLRNNTRVCKLLAQSFYFDLETQGSVLNSFKIKGDWLPIAREAAGGAFLLSTSGYLLYVTSEGGAGVIAASLKEGLQLMVTFPYWNSLLHFSGGGDIAKMRRAVPYLEQDLLAYEPEIEHYRSFLKSELSLPEASDPIALLHYAVEVLSPGVEFDLSVGEEFHSLFNTLTIDNTLF
ncbi:MAG: hypothetical protein ABI947_04900 [Chloroflexota bacterium]